MWNFIVIPSWKKCWAVSGFSTNFRYRYLSLGNFDEASFSFRFNIFKNDSFRSSFLILRVVKKEKDFFLFCFRFLDLENFVFVRFRYFFVFVFFNCTALVESHFFVGLLSYQHFTRSGQVKNTDNPSCICEITTHHSIDNNRKYVQTCKKNVLYIAIM